MGRGGRLMRASRKLLAVILVLTAGALAASCGGSPPQNRELVVGDIGWDENVAVSNLTKALLEDELNYQDVELRMLDVANLFQGVGNGDLDAFQDVWIPNHQAYLGQVQDDVELLDPWFEGTTKFGIAVPSYVGITTIPELNQTDAQEILGIEPGAAVMEAISDEVIPTYNLEQELVESSTAGMLAEVENRYDNREDFAFIAWSPHWMNQRYDFRYLDDPEDTLGNLNDPSELSTVVNEDLRRDDPVAYAFMDALTLTEEHINEAGDPLEGARRWAQSNRDVVEPWLEAARQAREA
jgi:glycine betaine/proline transport system substrate-binding protein